ncbi:MAG TPA: MarR family transcriptional regulator [Clostridiales bacterium UBA8960]|nr:MarR family transcriptional regulator [Clostridiales bacterium UBA8960]
MDDALKLRESLRKLERILGMLDKTQASCCGTNLSQCQALVEIGRRDGLTVNGLADILMLDKSTTSRIIQYLVDQNWVIRSENAEDRRIQEVSLTSSGLTQYETIEASMNDFYQKVFTNIVPSQRESLVENIAELVSAIEKIKMDNYFPCL